MTEDLQLRDGRIIRVDVLSPSVFRIRVNVTPTFRESGMSRYGILRREWPDVAVTVDRSEAAVTFRTSAGSLSVELTTGRVALTAAEGDVRTSEVEPGRNDEKGFDLALALHDDDRLYGMGDETRDRVQKRGHRNKVVVRNVASYTPIPFLMSSRGWGIFLNTTWFHEYDAGATNPDVLRFSAPKGDLDYFLFLGDSLPDLLDHYTQLTGRPSLLPRWGYGLVYVHDEREVRARDVLYEARNFRDRGIPCDVISLEPDWMSKHYDFSVNKAWSEERFHTPFWLQPRQQGTFAGGLENMGFKLSLWLCCDYDFSEYEEAQLKKAGRSSEASYVDEPTELEDDLIKDPNFVPSYVDTITKRGEPWFEHLKKFVDEGAQAFKLDGSKQICFHPDRKWANGMDDAEMHNLYPLIYGKQMSLGYREHTGRRSMIFSASGYAGTQQYTATWAGDTGGAEKPLTSLINHGLTGHSNTTCDMDVKTVQGIHFGFMQPWSQAFSWHQYNQPWFLDKKRFTAYKFYARLRYSLVPYLYSAAHVAAQTGFPVLRGMPLVAPEDPASDDLLLQYMLGDSLLTGAFTDTFHLPEGRWIDFWTGEATTGPCDVPATYPENRGGVLFVKAGAIIPRWSYRDFTDEGDDEEILLDVYPWEKSHFTLFEDDGVSLAYLNGAVSSAQFDCVATEDEIEVRVGSRTGTYDGMPERRVYNVRIFCVEPSAVSVDDVPVAVDMWRYDAEADALDVTVAEVPGATTTLCVTL
ncbi:MAG: DUF5110 domain-containing protein [Lentisphaerae bacterium]|jgi:alpha-glucosidase|nr:DUF5110 domain-containing protein [Lentisphaerota bacterium]MBT4815932.1 DUF5110 domain-containing protein [Lentisphaerota bacterium]MBT5608633.1 DUF5110 domain-containing protein [Lentisphaerota bacterium]MBT7057798.1 DUF5110 domain-containing protein [Lentisphaerota bacterium]MBT7842903.1 DUF5110 domain-containing protein [Lentisphaerota bacterium]